MSDEKDLYDKLLEDGTLDTLEADYDSLIGTDEDLLIIQGEAANDSFQAGLPMEIQEVEYEVIEAPKFEDTHEERDQDFQFARDNIYDTIGTATKALKQIASIAPKSGKGRDFEVVSLLAKTIVDSQKLLLDLHKKKQEIEKEEEKQPGDDAAKHYTQNNMYITTSELGKLARKIKEEIKED